MKGKHEIVSLLLVFATIIAGEIQVDEMPTALKCK
jgi:hypothetical protein